jgi:cytochrome c peroxidase
MRKDNRGRGKPRSRFEKHHSHSIPSSRSRNDPTVRARWRHGCASPYYTDNLMHNLQTERFYTPRMVNGMKASADGPIKTFTLRGIKDSPPYLHDGRLLTLDDRVEFFNLIMQLKLRNHEKGDLIAFLRAL